VRGRKQWEGRRKEKEMGVAMKKKKRPALFSKVGRSGEEENSPEKEGGGTRGKEKGLSIKQGEGDQN